MAKKADVTKKRKSSGYGAKKAHSQNTNASMSKGTTKPKDASISKGKASGGIGKILAGKGCILPILTVIIVSVVIIIL